MIADLLAALALSVALAMDAFAVALTQGARFRPGWKQGAAIALTFGAFQGLMPLAGWLLGSFALAYVEAWDHWIAFALLAFIGVQMIRASDDTYETGLPPLSGAALLTAAVATSIDAFAAGLTLPALGVPPLAACALIALVTAALSGAALLVGRRAGDRFGRPAEIAGGVLLIVLGASIAFEHVTAA
ncbi:manganese efflux pump MntP [Croceibacterium aestuarii]|uniref:manganese efflux pump MntP n=1 Tax=Croceibacterium aestuarii TaxID=3064139 RepID=UPI00272E594E|nr:manganese efflux pump MntP family protein [Croceibacterium sp. D39]